jgi:hypothetical protein
MSLVARTMANEMAAQLEQAWVEVKGPDVPFPGGGGEDSLIMFLAVSRGLLKYLEAHKSDMVRTITFSGGSPITVTSVDPDTELIP